MIPRSECTCECHNPGVFMMHVVACCHDPLPSDIKDELMSIRIEPVTEGMTADQARELSKKNDTNSILLDIHKCIKIAASNGEYSIKYRASPLFTSTTLYGKGEIDYPSKALDIMNVLRTKGYKAEVSFEERQFVDVYLLVSWAS